MGMAIELFKDLRLSHLIPRARLTRPYMLRLLEGITYSSTILAATRRQLPQPTSPKHRLLKVLEYLLEGKLAPGIVWAKYQGQRKAQSFLRRQPLEL